MSYKAKSSLTVTAIDIENGTPVSGAIVRLATINRSMNVENLSDEMGNNEYVTDGYNHYNLSVQRERYVSYVKEMCISKNSLNKIKIPLIQTSPEINITKVQICLSGDSGVPDLSFKIYCPQSIIIFNF